MTRDIEVRNSEGAFVIPAETLKQLRYSLALFCDYWLPNDDKLAEDYLQFVSYNKGRQRHPEEITPEVIKGGVLDYCKLIKQTQRTKTINGFHIHASIRINGEGGKEHKKVLLAAYRYAIRKAKITMEYPRFFTNSVTAPPKKIVFDCEVDCYNVGFAEWTREDTHRAIQSAKEIINAIYRSGAPYIVMYQSNRHTRANVVHIKGLWKE